jgi:hypothetical protein
MPDGKSAWRFKALRFSSPLRKMQRARLALPNPSD